MTRHLRGRFDGFDDGRNDVVFVLRPGAHSRMNASLVFNFIVFLVSKNKNWDQPGTPSLGSPPAGHVPELDSYVHFIGFDISDFLAVFFYILEGKLDLESLTSCLTWLKTRVSDHAAFPSGKSSA